MIKPEISCQNCKAACCKGNPFLLMQLSPIEFNFMKLSGNVFQTIEEPEDYDRDDARYPVDVKINLQRRTLQWIYLVGRETEPLPAGMGRYALLGACRYLVTDENGWEHCGVYEERPQVCQDFEMGAPKCVIFRRSTGVDPM